MAHIGSDSNRVLSTRKHQAVSIALLQEETRRRSCARQYQNRQNIRVCAGCRFKRERGNPKHVGCMAHLRRKFSDTRKSQPNKNKTGKVRKADIAISKQGKLYKIEKEIENLSILEKYHERPKRTYTATVYATHQWPKLMRYCDDGSLHMSNILAENSIRQFVIGRKAHSILRPWEAGD